MPCEHCRAHPEDGGGCVFPTYGMAPHDHDFRRTGSFLGSTVVLPRDEWPDNFEEDPESPGCGTYTHCPECGDAETFEGGD